MRLLRTFSPGNDKYIWKLLNCIQLQLVISKTVIIYEWICLVASQHLWLLEKFCPEILTNICMPLNCLLAIYIIICWDWMVIACSGNFGLFAECLSFYSGLNVNESMYMYYFIIVCVNLKFEYQLISSIWFHQRLLNAWTSFAQVTLGCWLEWDELNVYCAHCICELFS